MEELQKPLATETDTDIKYQVDVLTDLRSTEQEIQNCRDNIATLEKNSNVLLKQIQLQQLEKIIKEAEDRISALNRKTGQAEQNITNTEERLSEKRVALAGQQGLCAELAARYETEIPLWNREYEKQRKDKSREQFKDNFARRRKANQTTIAKCTESMTNAMTEYKTAHDFGAAATLEGYPEFEAEYVKLKNSELLKYEEKVENARQSAEQEFREQFLAKLQENMKNAQTEFKELNRALKDIRFSNERYEFLFMPSKSTENEKYTI